jgi:hypothetical protein
MDDDGRRCHMTATGPVMLLALLSSNGQSRRVSAAALGGSFMEVVCAGWIMLQACESGHAQSFTFDGDSEELLDDPD